jgi:hypothetical protein
MINENIFMNGEYVIRTIIWPSRRRNFRLLFPEIFVLYEGGSKFSEAHKYLCN